MCVYVFNVHTRSYRTWLALGGVSSCHFCHAVIWLKLKYKNDRSANIANAVNSGKTRITLKFG